MQVCLHKIGVCLQGKLTICIDNAGPPRVPALYQSLTFIFLFFSRKLHGMFFIMLAALALFDSLYILLSLWEAMRREMSTNDFFAYAVRYVTYPLQNIVLCITIFLPVALAFERYRAIRYVLDVLWCQPIKLIPIVSTSEF